MSGDDAGAKLDAQTWCNSIPKRESERMACGFGTSNSSIKESGAGGPPWVSITCTSDLAMCRTTRLQIVVNPAKPAAKRPVSRMTMSMKVRRTPPPYPEVEAARALANHGRTCNNAPKNMLLKVGTNTNDVRHEAIEVLEEDGDAPITDVVLPTTRVSKDSAASSNVHIRIERANVQYRIDGVLLPDRGATSGSQLLETSLIGSVDLVTGAWSAQYGLQQPVSGTLTSDHPVTEGVPSSPTGGAHVCAAMGQRTSERRMSQ